MSKYIINWMKIKNFKVFDELIESIKIDNGSDYFINSGIRGDGFVHNILTLEIFCIILPNADEKNKDIYISLEDARLNGLNVLPIDINFSYQKFVIDEKDKKQKLLSLFSKKIKR